MALRPMTPKRRRLLIGGAVLVVFATALALWVAGPDPKTPELSPGGQQALAGPSSAPSTPAAPKPSASPGKAAASGPLSMLPALPESTDVNGAGPPMRSVKMTITSDAAILRMGYLVKGGNPDKYATKNLRSPAVITTIARGYGLVAEIGAQASPYSTYLTCTVEVDGQVHMRRTVHGAWKVAVCIG